MFVAGMFVAGMVIIFAIAAWISSIPEKLTAPELTYKISHSGFLSNSLNASRTLTSGVVEVEMSDNKKYYALSGPSEQIGDKIFVEAKSTAKGHEDDDVEIIVSGGGITRSAKNSLTLTNMDFGLGETKFTVTAKNEAGEMQKDFVIIKTSVAKVCQEQGEMYDYDFAKLVEPLESYCKDWYAYVQNQNGSSSNNNNSTNNGSGGQTGSNTSSGNVCIHYEYGRCWDDLEDQAYSSGQWDRLFGTEGDDYNPPDWCTGVCADIYEYSYYEGYDDY